MLNNIKAWLWPMPLIIALLGLWEISVRTLVDATLVQRVVPTPSGIAEQLWVKADVLAYHGGITLIEIILGLASAVFVGVGTALLIFHSKVLERAFYPIIILSQNIPVFAIAPLLVIWMGFDIGPKVVVAALIAFFPIVVNTVDGLRSTDPELNQLFTIFDAKPQHRLLYLNIPSALPHLFSGLKVGVTLAVVGAVIGDWVGPNAGLGHFMLAEKRLLHVDAVFAAIVWLSMLGLVLFAVVTGLERLALQWKYISSSGYNHTRTQEDVSNDHA
jgi:putative hydroxymethylpyrimidine transport system permease protein